MLKTALKHLLTAAIFLIIDAVVRSFSTWTDSGSLAPPTPNILTERIEDQEDPKEKSTPKKKKKTSTAKSVSSNQFEQRQVHSTTKMSSATKSEPKPVEIVDLFDDDDEPQASQPKKRTIENER